VLFLIFLELATMEHDKPKLILGIKLPDNFQFLGFGFDFLEAFLEHEFS
jgi:hypothetical protein